MTALAWSRAYPAFGRAAFRQGLSERGAIAGRLVFYAIILLIFSRLWEVVASSEALRGLGRAELIWYLAVTEWVTLSLPPIYLEIEQEVRSGEIACRLSRPVSYLGSKLAEAAGETALRLLLLAVFGVGIAWALAGAGPADVRGLLLAVPLGIGAATVGLLFHAAIGVTAVWLQDCSPVYWIWQKCAFVLGGLMLPLDIYPDWLRAIAQWTPFSALMYGPGRMAFGFDPAFAADVALRLVVWGVLAAALLAALYRRALRALEVNGG